MMSTDSIISLLCYNGYMDILDYFISVGFNFQSKKTSMLYDVCVNQQCKTLKHLLKIAM